MNTAYLRLVFIAVFASTTLGSFCGKSGVPYSFEVLTTGAPVLGCAQPSCVFSTVGDIKDDSEFLTDVNGQPDGFFRDGDRVAKQYRHKDAPKILANCSGGFNELSCSKKNQWVGGIEYIDHPRQPLILQCCTFPGLRFSQEVGSTTVGAGEAITGGEVIRNGRQISFDVISNVKKVVKDNKIRYEVTVRRMNCLPDPPEPEVQFEEEVPTEVYKVLSSASNKNIGTSEKFEKKESHLKPDKKAKLKEDYTIKQETDLGNLSANNNQTSISQQSQIQAQQQIPQQHGVLNGQQQPHLQTTFQRIPGAQEYQGARGIPVELVSTTTFPTLPTLPTHSFPTFPVLPTHTFPTFASHTFHTFPTHTFPPGFPTFPPLGITPSPTEGAASSLAPAAVFGVPRFEGFPGFPTLGNPNSSGVSHPPSSGIQPNFGHSGIQSDVPALASQRFRAFAAPSVKRDNQQLAPLSETNSVAESQIQHHGQPQSSTTIAPVQVTVRGSPELSALPQLIQAPSVPAIDTQLRNGASPIASSAVGAGGTFGSVETANSASAISTFPTFPTMPTIFPTMPTSAPAMGTILTQMNGNVHPIMLPGLGIVGYSNAPQKK